MEKEPTQEDDPIKVFIRMISSPFLFGLLFISNIYTSSVSVCLWIKNGGEFKINESKESSNGK